MTLKLSDLTVLQNKLAFSDEFAGMIEFVAAGGFFTETAILEFAQKNTLSRSLGTKPKLINIPVFEDGKKFIHDGHHRTAAIFLGGRDYLSEDEYKISNMLYSQYDEINPVVGFVTPFNPIAEIRKDDFGDFKNTAMKLFADGRADEAITYIRRNKRMYAVPRIVSGIHELVSLYRSLV